MMTPLDYFVSDCKEHKNVDDLIRYYAMDPETIDREVNKNFIIHLVLDYNGYDKLQTFLQATKWPMIKKLNFLYDGLKDLTTVQQLIKLYKDKKLSINFNIIEYCSIHGSADVFEYLLEATKNTKLCPSHKNLWKYVVNNNPESDAMFAKLVKDYSSYIKLSTLYLYRRRFDRILILHQHGLNIHQIDPEHGNLLHIMALEGNLQACKWLIEQGCKTNHVVIDEDRHLLKSAYLGGNIELFEYLKDICPEKLIIDQVVHGSGKITDNNFDMIHYLIDQDYQLDSDILRNWFESCKFPEQRSPQTSKLVHRLLDHGADVVQLLDENENRSYLYYAIMHCDASVIDRMIKAGTSLFLELADNHGYRVSILHFICHNDDFSEINYSDTQHMTEVIKVLVDNKVPMIATSNVVSRVRPEMMEIYQSIQ